MARIRVFFDQLAVPGGLSDRDFAVSPCVQCRQTAVMGRAGNAAPGRRAT
jgi:hypothetical protein